MNDAINVEDRLISGLSFKFDGTANYIKRRRICSFQSQGDSFTPGIGNKILKFHMASSGSWLDTSTLRVQFDIQNTDPRPEAKLRFISNCSSLFERMTLSIGSVIIEDISDANRVSQLLNFLDSKDCNTNQLGESHGHEFLETSFNTLCPKFPDDAAPFEKGQIATAKLGFERKINARTYPGIKGTQSITCAFALPFGIMKSGKYIPLQFAPLTISLYLVSDITEPIISAIHTGANAAADLVLDETVAGTKAPLTTFYNSNTSLQYKLINCEVKADLLELDSSFESQYIEHLNNNGSLTLAYTNHVSQIQVLQQQRLVNVMVSRAVSKINRIFISFQHDEVLKPHVRHPSAKSWRCFYSPMRNTSFVQDVSADADGLMDTPLITNGVENEYVHDPGRELKISLLLGGKMLTESPLNGHAECYSKLVSALGSKISENNYSSFQITPHQYRQNRFIACIGLNTCYDASMTGYSVKSGDQLNIKVEFANTNLKEIPTRMHILIENEAVLQIKSTGVVVIE